jgi:hypothetical protein
MVVLVSSILRSRRQRRSHGAVRWREQGACPRVHGARAVMRGRVFGAGRGLKDDLLQQRLDILRRPRSS